MKSIFKFIIGSLLSSRAHSFLRKHRVQVIGITGSVGKTSTKEAVYHLLRNKFNVARSKKSFNTEIGMSLAILGEESSGFSSPKAWLGILQRAFFEKRKAPAKMVLEMGADGPGDIRRLMKIAPPRISVVTQVAPVHLDEGQFSSIEEIAKEKGSLVRYLPKSGLAVLNYDNPYIRDMETPAAKMTYGVHNPAMVMAKDIHATQKEIRFTVTYKGREQKFVAPVIGEFQVYVLLPAIAIGLSMGMSLAECAEHLKDFRLPPGRMNPIEGVNGSYIIDGSYNASPTTVMSALDMLLKFKAFRKIAALGTMNELGEHSYQAHIEIGEKAAQIAELLVCVGKEANTIKKGAMSYGMKEEDIYTFFDSADAGKFLLTDLVKGDIVLVKGSQNMVRMERLVEKIMKDPSRASELLCRQGEAWSKK